MEIYTGAIQSTKDDRDYLFDNIAGSKPYDWREEYDIEKTVGKINYKDQENTSSCGGFAWSYLSYVLDPTNREEKSPKFIYAHTKVGNGGSAGRTNCDLCVKKGVASESTCPLPKPLTEHSVSDKSDISDEAYKDALTNKSKSYVSVSTDIDSVAKAIRDNGGVVIGISGQNNGTWHSTMPKKPTSYDVWRHWVFGGKVAIIGGKKCIGILNSWGNIGNNGWQWIEEDYFDGRNIWEVWTMSYDEQLVKKFVFTKTLRIGSRGLDVKMLQTKLGIMADGIFGRMTDRAVKDFQKVNGLVVDGIVGKNTNYKLNSI